MDKLSKFSWLVDGSYSEIADATSLELRDADDSATCGISSKPSFDPIFEDLTGQPKLANNYVYSPHQLVAVKSFAKYPYNKSRFPSLLSNKEVLPFKVSIEKKKKKKKEGNVLSILL